MLLLSASPPVPHLFMPCPRTPPRRDTMCPPSLRSCLSWHTTQHRHSCIALVQGHNMMPPFCALPWDATQSCLSPWCLSWHTTQLFAVALGRDTMSLLPSAAESARRPPFPFPPPLACKPWPAQGPA